MENLIYHCARLHIDHICQSGDPFESGSSRPLDFGHWSAHKLEDLSGYELRHGEAVAIGIALDTLYAFHKGMISEPERRKVLSLLQVAGFRLYHRCIRDIDFPAALAEFQQHLGGCLSIPLIRGIGNLVEVHEIDRDLMQRCAGELEATYGGENYHEEAQWLSNDRSPGIGHVFPGQPRQNA